MKALALEIARQARGPILGLLLSVVLCGLLVLAVGESPAILWDATKATLFTSFGIGYTLYYATPLIFTGHCQGGMSGACTFPTPYWPSSSCTTLPLTMVMTERMSMICSSETLWGSK